MKKQIYYAMIKYTMDEGHKDFREEYRDKELIFDDFYRFDEDRDPKDARYVALEDMMLVVGGGYDREHINVKGFIFVPSNEEMVDRLDDATRAIEKFGKEGMRAIDELKGTLFNELERFSI